MALGAPFQISTASTVAQVVVVMARIGSMVLALASLCFVDLTVIGVSLERRLHGKHMKETSPQVTLQSPVALKALVLPIQMFLLIPPLRRPRDFTRLSSNAALLSKHDRASANGERPSLHHLKRRMGLEVS
jgi:hypothetical protein